MHYIHSGHVSCMLCLITFYSKISLSLSVILQFKLFHDVYIVQLWFIGVHIRKVHSSCRKA
jgi:hypothetical protein